MRIAYLLSQYPVPTQTFAQSDVEALRRLGHDVVVFTMKPAWGDPAADMRVQRPSLRGTISWPGALIRFRSSLPHLFSAILSRLFQSPLTALAALASLPRAAEIADAISRGRYDVVHLFWARHAGLVLAMLKARHASPLRSVFVGAYDLVADDFLVSLALDAAQIAVSHAEVNRSYLRRRTPARTPTAIIRRGIPLLAHADDIPRDPTLWVTASALVPEKNVGGVIRAFAIARTIGRLLRLEIYGDGPDKARLEALCRELGCADGVTFAGHVDRMTLFEAMQRARAFVLLSKKSSERLPNVVKEALWAGCIVISSNSDGIDELLPDQELGLVVDPDDPEAVESAIMQVLQRDASGDIARITKARTLIAEHYSAEKNMAAYVAHWRQLGQAREARHEVPAERLPAP